MRAELRTLSEKLDAPVPGLIRRAISEFFEEAKVILVYRYGMKLRLLATFKWSEQRC